MQMSCTTANAGSEAVLLFPCHSDDVSRTAGSLQDLGQDLNEPEEEYQTVCSRAVAGWMSQAKMKRMSHLGCKSNSLTSGATITLFASGACLIENRPSHIGCLQVWQSMRSCVCQVSASHGPGTVPEYVLADC